MSVTINPTASAVPQPRGLTQMANQLATQLPGFQQYPTIQVGAGAGNGSGGSATITPNNSGSGALVTLVTGSTNNSTNSIAAAVTFPVAFASPPSISIDPASATTANLNASQGVYTVASTTGFNINTTGGALSNGTTYIWSFIWQG